MKQADKTTLWKRATSEKRPRTEFDSVVHTLTSYLDTSRKENLDDVLSVLKQLDSEKTGKTKELFNAVQNVLENLKLELVESRSGVATVLRDVGTFLVDAKTTSVLERESARLDELLERLDFVASGGTDGEVPRVQKSDAEPESVVYVPKLPIKLPKHFEDPRVLQVAERLESLNAILSAHVLGTSESQRKQRLELEHLQLANYCLSTARHKTKINLKTFATKLTKDISAALAEISNKPVDFVNYDVNDGVMYRSLAEVFRWKLRDLAVTIGTELTSSPDGKILFEICCRESYVSTTVKFVGLRTAFDLISQRMDDLSAKLEDSSISELGKSNAKALSSTAKTRKERIAHSLVEFRQFVDLGRGQFELASNQDDQLTMTVILPSKARVVNTFPILVGSDLFLLEAHLLTASLDSTKVQWNESQSSIEYSDHSYQHCWISEDIKPTTDVPSWILLLDTHERKLAIEVETIKEPEFHIAVPSVSEINHGHKYVGERKLKLLLDPSELRPNHHNLNSSDNLDDSNKHFLCLNVSQPLEDKIRRCASADQVLVRHTKTVSETLSQLQEFRPDYLIIEDQLDEFRAVDAVTRLAHAMPFLKVKVLIFFEDSTQSLEQMNHQSFELTCFAQDVDFGRLKDVLVAN